MNRAGLDLLRNFEGFRSDAYKDIVGVPTIGFGFTKGVTMGDHMTIEAAEARLQTELVDYEKGMTGTDNQIAAMTCLAWNIGIHAFQSSTVRMRHLAGDYPGAADAFRLWCKAGGKTVYGLVRRREAERALYLTEAE